MTPRSLIRNPVANMRCECKASENPPRSLIRDRSSIMDTRVTWSHRVSEAKFFIFMADKWHAKLTVSYTGSPKMLLGAWSRSVAFVSSHGCRNLDHELP